MNKKMIEAARTIRLNSSLHPYADISVQIGMELQAGINAAWKRFDPDNPDTWPENAGVGYLVKCAESPHGYEVCWFEYGTFYSVGIPVREPTEYCLINDIKPSWKKDNDNG